MKYNPNPQFTLKTLEQCKINYYLRFETQGNKVLKPHLSLHLSGLCRTYEQWQRAKFSTNISGGNSSETVYPMPTASSAHSAPKETIESADMSLLKII